MRVYKDVSIYAYIARPYLGDDLASDLTELSIYIYNYIYIYTNQIYNGLRDAIWESTSSIREKIRGSEPRGRVGTARRRSQNPQGRAMFSWTGSSHSHLTFFLALSVTFCLSFKPTYHNVSLGIACHCMACIWTFFQASRLAHILM